MAKLEKADATLYDFHAIGFWKTLLMVNGSVWRRKTLWQSARNVVLLALVVTILVVCIVADVARLRVGQFQKLGTFLNVFVGLLLGFFMTASMKRWYACVDGFLILTDTIRQLQIELLALGVQENKVNDILRYGVLSVRLLNMELHLEAMHESDQKEQLAREMWAKLKEGKDVDSVYGRISEEELQICHNSYDPSAHLWLWVGQIIGNLAQDGDVPPMASPTYGMLAGRRAVAHSGIRKARSSICIQPPYIYVHMMAVLVHVNNIVNGISFGLTFGTTIGTVSIFYKLLHGAPVGFGEMTRDMQSVIVSFVLSILGPLIYQALLETSIAIAEPYSSLEGEIPTAKFVRQLERDLRNGHLLALKLPGKWRPPQFKQPPPPAPAPEPAAKPVPAA